MLLQSDGNTALKKDGTLHWSTFQAWNFLRALLGGHFAEFRTLLSPACPELAAQRPLQQPRRLCF
jgi:predicted ATPase